MCIVYNLALRKNGTVNAISQGTTSNLEFTAIKFRHFYFQRHFSCVTLTAVYVHPHADTNTAVKDLHNTVYKCENDDPNTVSIVADFNKQN